MRPARRYPPRAASRSSNFVVEVGAVASAVAVAPAPALAVAVAVAVVAGQTAVLALEPTLYLAHAPPATHHYSNPPQSQYHPNRLPSHLRAVQPRPQNGNGSWNGRGQNDQIAV